MWAGIGYQMYVPCDLSLFGIFLFYQSLGSECNEGISLFASMFPDVITTVDFRDRMSMGHTPQEGSLRAFA